MELSVEFESHGGFCEPGDEGLPSDDIRAELYIGDAFEKRHPNAGGGGLGDDTGGRDQDDVEVRVPLEIGHVDPYTSAECPGDSGDSSPEMHMLRSLRERGVFHEGLQPILVMSASTHSRSFPRAGIFRIVGERLEGQSLNRSPPMK